MATTSHHPSIGDYRKIRLHPVPNAGGYWEVWWTDHAAGSVTRKQSTKTKIRSEAEAYLRAFCDDVRAQTPGVAAAPAVPTVDELCGRWLVYAAGAGKTDQRYILAALRRDLGHHPADRIDEALLQDYGAQRKATDGTIRRELGALRTVLNWAARGRLIPREVPSFGGVLPPDNPPRTRFLDPAQEQELWDKAMQSRDPRVKLFVALGLETAARRTAICELTWDRVDLKLGQINYQVAGARITKKRRVRVPISDRLLPVLQEAWLQAPKDAGGQATGPVVTKILPRDMSRVFMRFTRKAGLEWVTPHVLRHSWASLAAMNGVSLWDIAQIMGDTIAVIERAYLHLTPGHLRSAINHKAAAGKTAPAPARAA